MTEQQPAGTDPAPEGTEQTEPIRLPDDHPLVTALAAQKAQNATLREQASARADGERTAEERIAALETRTATAERAALIAGIQAKHGISDEDARIFLTATDAAALGEAAAALAAKSSGKQQTHHVPTEGKTPASGESDGRTFVRSLFAQSD